MYAKLVHKDTKRTLYSSHSKCKFVEIAIDSKKAETINNFSSYQTLKLDKNSWGISSPKKIKKSWQSWQPIAVKLLTTLLLHSFFQTNTPNCVNHAIWMFIISLVIYPLQNQVNRIINQRVSWGYVITIIVSLCYVISGVESNIAHGAC